jgi:hypothetical protein
MNMVANPWSSGEIWIAYPRTDDTITTTYRPLYHSIDGGQSFVQLTSLPRANFVALGKGNEIDKPFIYVHGRDAGASKDGIYKSEDQGVTWQLISNPNVNQFSNITSMEADQREKDLVYIGTGGRGIFWGSAENTIATKEPKAAMGNKKAKIVRISPNPTKDLFTITSEEAWDTAILKNKLGQTLRIFTNGSLLTLADLAADVYTLEIYSKKLGRVIAVEQIVVVD